MNRIDAATARARCKVLLGDETCSFFGVAGAFFCLKGTAHEAEIKKRGAARDNCSGPPDYVVETK